MAHGIAKWNGSTWEALGSGLGLDDGGTWAEQGCAFALAVDSQHNLYVGGSFLSAGGVPAKFIAKWSPSCGTWSALGSGMEDYVEEIATSDTTVYAAGQFANAGGVAGTARLAQWNGVTWAPVRPLGTAGPNGYVIALSSGGGSLYAGGNFTSIGGVATSYVARWDGTNWHPLGVGISGGAVVALEYAGGVVYAGGNFDSAGGQPASRIAKWDGVQWAPLGDGVNDSVVSLAPFGGGLYYYNRT